MKVKYKSFSVLLLLLFLLKPNFNSISPLITRGGDLLFIFLFFMVFIFTTVRVPLRWVKIFIGILLVFSVSFTLTIIFDYNSVFNAKDLNEVFRFLLFILLPFLVGYNPFAESYMDNKKLINNFCFVLFTAVAAIMLCQALIPGNNVFIQSYSQAGLFQGRSTGVALFIQEIGWILLSLCSLLIFIKPHKRYVYFCMISPLLLLTASKSVILMMIIYILSFMIITEGRRLIRPKFVFSILVIVFLVSLVFYYLYENNEQFRVSVYDSIALAIQGDYSDKSFSARIESFDLFLDAINNSPYLIFTGFLPLTTHDTIRFEVSFLNLLAKYGLVGFMLLSLSFFMPLVKNVNSNAQIYYFRASLLSLCIAIFITSLTGATLEGVKASFLYFVILGFYSKIKQHILE